MFGFASGSLSTIHSSVLPTVANAFNIGSATKPIKSLFLNDSLEFTSLIPKIVGPAGDDGVLFLCGGSDADESNGPFIELGAVNSGLIGQMRLVGGAAGQGNIRLELTDPSAFIELFSTAGRAWSMAPNGHFIQESNGGPLVFNVADSGVRAGAATLTVHFGGGLTMATSSGALISASGNSHASTPGRLDMFAGNVSGGNMRLGTMFDEGVEFHRQGLRRWLLGSSGSLAQDATNGGDIVFSKSVGVIRQSTSDGSDNRLLGLFGGGSGEVTRGAAIFIYGNETGDVGGIVYRTGNPSGVHRFLTGNALERFRITEAGVLSQDATNGGLLQFNRANTTINFAGTMGTSSADPTTDAPDGWLEFQRNGTPVFVGYHL